MNCADPTEKNAAPCTGAFDGTGIEPGSAAVKTADNVLILLGYASFYHHDHTLLRSYRGEGSESV